MRRTTTPTHIFSMDIDPSTITELVITYAQSSDVCGCTQEDQETRIILTKTLSDCVIGENYVSVKLTQEETNLFAEDVAVQIQLHAKVGNDSLMSDIKTTPCRRVLNDEVL